MHVPCLRIRGDVRAPYTLVPADFRRQNCRCEPDGERWPGADVSRQYDLCLICARGLAGGTSRWAWLVCTTCRDVLRASEDSRLALAPLGRHSIMNATAVRLAASQREQAEQQGALVRTLAGWDDLHVWGDLEAGRLARQLFQGLTEVPLGLWRQRAPQSVDASRDAASRFGSRLDTRHG